MCISPINWPPLQVVERELKRYERKFRASFGMEDTDVPQRFRTKKDRSPRSKPRARPAVVSTPGQTAAGNILAVTTP